MQFNILYCPWQQLSMLQSFNDILQVQKLANFMQRFSVFFLVPRILTSVRMSKTYSLWQFILYYQMKADRISDLLSWLDFQKDQPLCGQCSANIKSYGVLTPKKTPLSTVHTMCLQMYFFQTLNNVILTTNTTYATTNGQQPMTNNQQQLTNIQQPRDIKQ